MKKNTLIFSRAFLLSGLFLVVFMMSCSKKTGPAGPVGPAGPAGAGSSGIIYSNWLDLAFLPDTIKKAGGTIDTLGYYATINAPKLTLDMLNTADVKVYINSNDTSNPTIYPLPYSSASGLYISVSEYVQTIQLYSNGDLSTFSSSGGVKHQQYRYMIIPGDLHAKSATPVNWSDYAAVKTHLGLKD